MVELLLKLEMSLWINETRNSKEYLENIINDTFYEIGQSGKSYNKKDILDNTSIHLETTFPFEDISIKEINTGTYLISYKVKYKQDGMEYHTHRTSIWLNNGEVFQLLFHQGTSL